MGKFRSWLELLVYRLTVSSEELSMARNDRKLMNNIRRNFNEVESRMRIHEKQGGSCSEIGGSGVSLNLMGFKVYVFRPIDEKDKKSADHSGESTVVSFEKYRTK
ncbi:hypothetical protein MPI44_004440 [Klebsiella oxytoca]|nr:hypothetical protein [Klebsiella oxytoca]HCL5581111.1 hypothetical protein [Citrobacter freundii]